MTCTAFTALLDESTKPLVIDPIKPGCAAVEVPSELSSDWGDFGDERSPKPLVRRAKVDFPEFPVGESSCEPENGWGIFKLLAHDDIPVAEIFDRASLAELSVADSVVGEGFTSEAFVRGEADESADPESILAP